MMRSSSAGSAGLSRDGGIGSRLRIASKMTADVSRERLAAPSPSRRAPRRTRTGRCARRAPRRAPARATCRPPCRAPCPGWSGARSADDRRSACDTLGRARASAPSLARPKSRILACPRSVTKMFAGLMSRWTMPLRVRGLERVGDLRSRARAAVAACSGRPAIRCLQRLALEQLHHDERPPVVLADVVDRADVRVVQGGRRPRLALEALERLRVLRQRRRAGT